MTPGCSGRAVPSPAPCSDARLRLRLPDPGRRWQRVTLAPEADLPRVLGVGPDALVAQHQNGGWLVDLPRPPLARLEYRFAVTGHDGGQELVCDPGAASVRTPFGDRSVIELPGYAAPAWLEGPAVGGRRTRAAAVRGFLGSPVRVSLWAPADATRGEVLPLLVVHDGPAYDAMASLTRYCAALIAAGRLPRHRVALLDPGDRDAWYSASPEWARTLAGPVMASLRSRIGVGPAPVVLGASLGGLAALTTAAAHPGLFAGVLSQSGSFFTPELDPQESGYRYYWRITDAVRALRESGPGPAPLRVGLTCGAAEENAGNNRAMAASLRRAGHRVTHAEVADVHTWTAWRDALDPHLTAVLLDVWG